MPPIPPTLSSNNPWPGYKGWRVTDNAGNMANVGQAASAYWSYLWSGTYVRQMANRVGGASTPNALYPYPTKNLLTMRPQEIGQPALTSQTFAGFGGASLLNANQSFFPNAVAVNWSTGSAVPPISQSLNFHVGGPISSGGSGDASRSVEGFVHSIATYREAHSVANYQAIQTFFDWHDFRRCYSIVTPNVQSSANCAAGYRDYYCGQTCRNGEFEGVESAASLLASAS